jgi:hypothetical protein
MSARPCIPASRYGGSVLTRTSMREPPPSTPTRGRALHCIYEVCLLFPSVPTATSHAKSPLPAAGADTLNALAALPT